MWFSSRVHVACVELALILVNYVLWATPRMVPEHPYKCPPWRQVARDYPQGEEANVATLDEEGSHTLQLCVGPYIENRRANLQAPGCRTLLPAGAQRAPDGCRGGANGAHSTTGVGVAAMPKVKGPPLEEGTRGSPRRHANARPFPHGGEQAGSPPRVRPCHWQQATLGKRANGC